MSPRISIRLLSGQSDERLLALAREGHERAFEALVQRYRRPLLRFCRRTMRLSDTRAEDVVQQSLLKVWMALAAGTEVRDFKPWLYSVVRNTALNAMRGHGENNVALTDAVRARAAADSQLEQGLEVRDALTYVAALPHAQREAIFLTVIDGQSHEEVASALGISNGAVRGLLYRARTTLRSAAAAITPQPLIAWAAGSAAPSSERIAEVSAGASALGAGGLLAKGAVLAVTAGALATGAVVQLGHSTPHHHPAASASAVASSATTPAAPAQRASASASPGTAATSMSAASAAPRGGGGTASPGGRSTHAGAVATPPSHHSPTHSRPQAGESEPRGPGNVSNTTPSAAPVPSATTATTAGTPTEQPAPAQTQPQAPPPTPPAEEPKSGEPPVPGESEPDDGTSSCTTAQGGTETLRCDE